MRKKKGADSVGDTASNLGVAMDELMRHQPTLRVNIISALITVSPSSIACFFWFFFGGGGGGGGCGVCVNFLNNFIPHSPFPPSSFWSFGYPGRKFSYFIFSSC